MMPVRYPSSSMGDIAPFGATGDVKKPSHVERESAVMPPLYDAPSRRPSSRTKVRRPVDSVIIDAGGHVGEPLRIDLVESANTCASKSKSAKRAFCSIVRQADASIQIFLLNPIWLD
jgi:hypothetical protein